jgi:hypothetical protein
MTRLTAFSALILLLAASEVSAQRRDRTPPTTPTNLHVVAITPYSVTLAWNPSTDNSGQFSYVICCANVSSETIPGGGSTHVYSAGLEALRPFTLRIYAVDAAGNYSKPSNSVSFTTPRDVTPPTTPLVSVTDVGPTHVSLAYSSKEDGPHVWFSVFMDGNRVVYLNRTPSTTIFFLEPQTTHTFVVQARDFANNLSPFSQPVAVTTKPANPNDVTPPTPPTNLRESHFDDGEIHLTWDQSTDDFDPQWIIRYDVHVNGVLSDMTVGRGRSIVYGESGVNTITVTAIDTAGNRSTAATIVVTL